MDRDRAATEAEPARAGGYLHREIAAELAAMGFSGAIEVGRGGFGVVYRCRQAGLDRTVAVKVVTVEGHEDRARFMREQRAMASLTAHPNILAVLQVGQTVTGYPFLVMAFCRSGSWQERIARAGRLGVDEVSRVGIKIAGALECARQAGIVHRDVKPGNVLYTDYGEPALSDFGIAHTESGFKTAPGIFHGSPAFTAPELLDGASPTAASDVYALGASLFNGLTGRPAFERRPGEQLLSQFMRIATQPLPDLRGHGIPADLAMLIEQAMARDPRQRPSLLELGHELQQLQARHGLPVDEMTPQRGDSTEVFYRCSAPQPDPTTWEKGSCVVARTPAPPATLVGRELELRRLRDLLKHSRLVTLIGVGGVGKTVLANHAVSRHTADYPDGVWVVELGELVKGSSAAQKVVATLGLRTQSARPSLEILVEVLSRWRALVVLDNCEQIIDDVARLVETVLPRCPNIDIIATSREVLAVGGEAVLAVSPLTLPSPGADLTVGALTEYHALALFIERARAAAPEFRPTEHNTAVLLRICARLDGLPLAIEQAAALLAAIPLEQLHHELCNGYELLQRGHSEGPTRQQTLISCIEWSFDLCTETEQLVWARLSVFAGNFDLAAARYVGGADLPPGEFLDHLCSLVDKSILIRTEDQGVVCFGLLQTLREYGRNRTTPYEQKRLGRLHADWYHQLLSAGASSNSICGEELRVGRLERELPNLRAALQFSLTDNPAKAADMVNLLPPSLRAVIDPVGR